MAESGTTAHSTPGTTPRVCPSCGGPLSEPISGDLHCYVECGKCGARFELDSPDLPSR